jgi:hypothetical protein
VTSRLEPAHLLRCDGKHSDSLTMIPWSQGKFLVWEATYTDTLCASNLRRSATEAVASAAHTESLKVAKYAYLSSAYHFVPIAVETLGTYGPEAAGFFKSLGQRLQTLETAWTLEQGRSLLSGSRLPSRGKCSIHFGLFELICSTGRFWLISMIDYYYCCSCMLFIIYFCFCCMVQ